MRLWKGLAGQRSKNVKFRVKILKRLNNFFKIPLFCAKEQSSSGWLKNGPKILARGEGSDAEKGVGDVEMMNISPFLKTTFELGATRHKAQSV
jgi:hypothetical protein